MTNVTIFSFRNNCVYLKLLLYILFSKLPLSTLLIYVHHIPCCTDPANAAATQASREEVDSRSVFVGNVRIECPSIIIVLLGNHMLLVIVHACLCSLMCCCINVLTYMHHA